MAAWKDIEPIIDKYERLFEITNYFSKMRSSVIGGAAPVVTAVYRDGKYEFINKYPDYIENALRNIDYIEKIYIEYERNR